MTKILIVEDNFIASDEIKDRLNNVGYTQLETAFHKQEALQKARSFQPDLILMDINLGHETDGISVVEQLKTEGEVAVIYLTAYDDRDTIQRATSTGPYGYVVKPFDERDLVIAIEIALYKQKMDQALRESEARYRRLADNTADMIATLDKDLNFTYVSPAVTALTGYTPEEYLALSSRKVVIPEDYEKSHRAYQERSPDNQDPFYFELRHYRKDGSIFWAEDITKPLCDDSGEVIGTLVVTRDITRRKQAELEREHLIKDLQTALEKVKTLTGLLPICANCKKIRDDKGYWHRVEDYIQQHADVTFTHSICQDCVTILYSDV